MLLDNWQQGITFSLTTTPGVYVVSGQQFLANAKVPIYGLTTFAVPADGSVLANIGTKLGTATTDADGKFSQEMAIDDKYLQLLADYGYPTGGSGVFEKRLDAVIPRDTVADRRPPDDQDPAGNFLPDQAGEADTPDFGIGMDDGRLVWCVPNTQPSARPVVPLLCAPASAVVGPTETGVQVAADDSDRDAHTPDALTDPLDPLAGVEPGVV